MTSPYQRNCPLFLLTGEGDSTRLKANADVAGIGVLVGLTIPALVVLILITIYFFFAVDPTDENMPCTELDKAFLKWFRHEDRWGWQHWRRDPKPIQKIILAFSDAQLVNAFSLLFSEYTLGWSIDAYHWQILVQCVWFASATHLATIPILKQQLQIDGNRPLIYIRAFLMTIVWALLVASLIPTGHPQWLFGSPEGTASPALCFFNYDYFKDDETDTMSTFGIIWLGWSISLVSITYLRRLFELVLTTSSASDQQTSTSRSSSALPCAAPQQLEIAASTRPVLPKLSRSVTAPQTFQPRYPRQLENGPLQDSTASVTPSTKRHSVYRLINWTREAVEYLKTRFRNSMNGYDDVVKRWRHNSAQSTVHPLLVVVDFLWSGILEATHTVWKLLGSFIWHIVWLFMMMMWNLYLLIFNKWYFNSVVDGDMGDNEWTFGQTMPVFLLILPAISILEVMLEKEAGENDAKPVESRWTPARDNETGTNIGKEPTHPWDNHSTRITVFLMFEFAMLFGLLATINSVDTPQNAGTAAGNEFLLLFLLCLVTAPLGFTYLIHLGDAVQRSPKMPTRLRYRNDEPKTTSSVVLRSIVAVVVGLGIGTAISFYFCHQYKDWLKLIHEHEVVPLDHHYFSKYCGYNNVTEAYNCCSRYDIVTQAYYC